MRRTSLSLALAASLALPALPAAAQSGPTVELRPYAGYMRFGDFLRGPAGVALTAEPGTAFGMQGSVNLGRSRFSVYGNAALARTRATVSGAPSVFGFDVGSVGLGTTTMQFFDGGVQMDLVNRYDERQKVVPFVQLGAGAVRYDVDNAIAEQFVTTSGTNFAGNVGLGADIRVTPSFAVNVLAKDYIADFRNSTTSQFGAQGRWANHLGLNVGVTFGF